MAERSTRERKAPSQNDPRAFTFGFGFSVVGCVERGLFQVLEGSTRFAGVKVLRFTKGLSVCV